MRKIFGQTLAGVLLSVALASGAGAEPPADPCARPATTLIIVRHADRAGQADSLSEAGVARARDLVRFAFIANVRAVYHSDTRRTRDTAAPLAAALELPLNEYPAKDVTTLFERILVDHLGEAVVIVGHSNTVPMIIAAAGGPAIPDLDEKEFDGLFVVSVPACGPATLTKFQYGAPSP